MTDYADLVKRLREIAHTQALGDKQQFLPDEMFDVADAIEALEAENKKLREALDAVLLQEDDLRQENKKLREALELAEVASVTRHPALKRSLLSQISSNLRKGE